MLAVSERMDFDSIYKVISKVVGQDIVYRQSAEGDMEQNDPVLGSIFEQMYEFFNEYGFAGDTKMLGRDEVSGLFVKTFCRTLTNNSAGNYRQDDIFRRVCSTTQLGGLS